MDRAHPKALEISGYNEKDWAGAPSIGDVWDEICARLEDAIIIGPADLSLRLGIPGALDDPKFTECVDALIAAAKKAGIASGIFMGDRARVKRYIEQGMRWFSCGSEEGLIRAGAKALVEDLRGSP